MKTSTIPLDEKLAQLAREHRNLLKKLPAVSLAQLRKQTQQRELRSMIGAPLSVGKRTLSDA